MRARASFFVMVMASLWTPAPSHAAEVVDGIAAQVGPDIVLMSEVVSLTAPLESQARAQGATDSDIERLRAEMLERLIERRLLEQASKRAELEATDAEVDGAIAAIAKENGLSLDQLKQSVETNGLSMEAYRARIRSEIQQAKILNGMVRSRIKVDEKDVQRLYDEKYSKIPDGVEEVHLRHLLVTFGKEVKRDEATACGQVRSALTRVRAGESFADVAQRVSEVAPERGGDLGWVPVGGLAPWLRDVIAPLKAGQVSDVVRQPFGCNLVQLVDRRTFNKKPYAEVRDELKRTLFDDKVEEEYVRFMDKLRKQTFIERKGAFAARASAPSTRPGPPPGELPSGGLSTP